MADQTRKQSLTAELDAARTHVAGYATALRHDLDLGARLKSSYSRNTVVWFGAAAVFGLLLSKIPPSRRKVVVKGPAVWNDQAGKAGKAAFGLTALKFALSIATPAITSLLKKKILDRPASQPTART